MYRTARDHDDGKKLVELNDFMKLTKKGVFCFSGNVTIVSFRKMHFVGRLVLSILYLFSAVSRKNKEEQICVYAHLSSSSALLCSSFQDVFYRRLDLQSLASSVFTVSRVL